MFSLRNQPLSVVILGLAGLLMIFPMLFAARVENWDIARVFLYHIIFAAMITIMFAIAFSGRQLDRRTARRLADILVAIITVPLILALPLHALLPQISLADHYFEMLSSLTTTGASFYPNPGNLPETVHLWRALVAWFGGGLMLVVALSMFQPAGLGGFEVYGAGEGGSYSAFYIRRSDIRTRVLRYSIQIFPIYAGLTIVLAFLLAATGMRSFSAAIYAMGVLSTSGISHIGEPLILGSGLISEFLIFIALFAAVSRFTFQQDAEGRGWKNLKTDKEINLMLFIIALVPLALFLRHWSGALDVSQENDWRAALQAFWGSVFTVLSFLTTTGYESIHWSLAQNWSGFGASATVLVGLCAMGGGIATTAGGIKLLRVYALYKHGLRELQRLSYPSSVMGAGRKARAIRREGAYIAWVFFMLFIVSISALMLAYSATGVAFEDAILLSVSGLSTTGPLLSVASESGLTYADLDTSAKIVFALSMVLGRLEVLAVIAILAPNSWTN